MRILISAAEAATDLHGSQLVSALKDLEDVEIFGTAGPLLRKEGVRAIVQAEDLLSMGFLEVLTRLPRLFLAMRALLRAAQIEKPDLAVLLDYSEFHLKLAKKLKQLGIPVVCYIPPKVWVWRRHRLKVIKENYDRVYTIIGFEEKLFRDAGILGSYVGNPTVEEIPETLNREQSRKDLGISESEKVLVLMPGSRPSELKRHLKLFLESANLIEKTSGPLRVLIPLAQTESPDGIKHKLDQWLIESKSGLKVSLHPGQAFTCLAAGDFGIIKSGTSTLEAGLIGLPHVVIYQVNAVSAFLFKKVIRYFGPVGLVNLAGLEREPCVESPRSFPELLGSNITPFLVAESVLNLISSGPLKEVRSAIENLKIKLKPHGSPSQTLAKELLMLVNSRK